LDLTAGKQVQWQLLCYDRHNLRRQRGKTLAEAFSAPSASAFAHSVTTLRQQRGNPAKNLTALLRHFLR
jgi:hypothetical protein